MKELKELSIALQNQFNYPLKNKKLKAYFLLLNTSISKSKLAKRESYYEIIIRPKYIKNLNLPSLSKNDIEFYSNYYDYLYILKKKNTPVIDEYVDNEHIFKILKEAINYLYLEMLYPDIINNGVDNNKGVYFREYFDKDISFENHHRKGRELPAKMGYIKNISLLKKKEQFKIIKDLYLKRREPDDSVRNYILLVPIRFKKLIKDTNFYEYKYTNFKKLKNNSLKSLINFEDNTNELMNTIF